jgi:hypothetical protein
VSHSVVLQPTHCTSMLHCALHFACAKVS